MRIGCDIDGVLSDFNQAFAEVLAVTSGRTLLHPEVHLQPTWPPCWDWPQAEGYTDDEVKAAWKAVKRDDMFWLRQAPLQGTADAIARLTLARNAGHDIYFITARPGRAAKLQTEVWLESWGMPGATVLITERKDAACDLLDLDAYIDDKLIAANACMAMFRVMRGQGRMYLKDAPYNQGPFSDAPVGGLGELPPGHRDQALTIVGSVGEMLDKEGL